MIVGMRILIDILARSTLAVEMDETAAILARATPRSLVRRTCCVSCCICGDVCCLFPS